MDSSKHCANHYIVYNKLRLIQVFIMPKIVYNISKFTSYKIKLCRK